MKKTSIVLLAALSALFFSSCEKVVGEGPVVTQTRSVSGFKAVSVSISGRVNYKIDPVYKVEVQAQQNILDILETNKVGDELVIKIKDGKRVKSHEDITVTISAPFADMINLSGSGNFFMTGSLSAATCNLRVSGSGSINADHISLTDKLTATVSGSGDIKVASGLIKEQSLRISGSGKIDLAGVVSDKAVTEISGSGDMWVNLLQSLEARISGSGSVHYRGTPAITTHISGSGRVQPF